MYRSPKGKPVSPSAAVKRNAAVLTTVFYDDNLMACVTAKHRRQPSVADIKSEVSKDEQGIMGHGSSDSRRRSPTSGKRDQT